VVLYRYVDVGKVLFLPDMYEPIWFGRKTLSAYLEGGGALLALLGALVGRAQARAASTAA
jgi:hypothetical protein